MSPVLDSSRRRRPPTLWFFLVISLGQIALMVVLGRGVLTDDVYRSVLGDQMGAAQMQAVLDTARTWETVGYFLAPFAMGFRVLAVAFLVQLVLMLRGVRPPLARVFRAGLVAQLAILSRSLTQVVWLATVPAVGRTPERIRQAPGSMASVLDLDTLGWVGTSLAETVGVFDLGWIVLFSLALEDGGRLRFRRALGAVALVWAGIAVSRWALSLYLANVV